MTLKNFKRQFLSELSFLNDDNEACSLFAIVMDSVLNLERHQIHLKLNDEIDNSTEKELISILSRLKKQEPIQYILNQTYFYDLELFVNENVLIPRQETEELVHLIYQDNKESLNLNILDICTGSGCIALALKSVLKESRVDALDVSKKALVVAKKNSSALNLAINFIEDDILNHQQTYKKYDVIVSNPPYVLETDKLQMKPNVLDYEPHLALFVENENPLLFYKAIAIFATNHLTKNGKLYFEIHEKYRKEIEVLLIQNQFVNIESIKDINGKFRMVKAQKI